MKNILYTTFCVAGLLAATSCSDYLNTSSPSIVDADFVFSNIETSRAAMDGVYEQWRATANNYVFGAGLFYAADITGSDIERHPERYANQLGRHIPEHLYRNGTMAGTYGLLDYQKEGSSGAYGNLYSMIGKANAIINAIQSMESFESMINASEASDLSQLYGEAIAARATAYRELIKYFGDVPYQSKNGVAAFGLSSRDSIYDVCIADLKTVEPLMFRVGEKASLDKNKFSRTYVQGLIGRLCMEAAGYQTRRTDLGADFYKDGQGNVLSFETIGTPNNDCVYERRNDWKALYETAKTYLRACVENSGSARFHSVDPRSVGKNGQIYDNPYQYFFQQMNELEYADESIYEYAMTQGVSDERPYSSGRVSSGGSKNAYPCKSFGQARINPVFYYGVFNPQDKRRDVSVCVTGSTGKGVEKLIPFSPNSKADGGGLTLNKWDENRMASPYVKENRKAGINGPYMRLAEIYLLYAEVCAATGDDATAKTYLKMIRERSFPSGKANTDAFIASCGSVYRAVIEERGFEFAGEGDRRFTLVRTGLLPEAIKKVKEQTAEMMAGLQTQGYYKFSNGNVISLYVWTKLVDAKTEYGYRLTTECPEGEKNNPVLYPGWRGQHDNWESFGLDYGTSTPKTNLAIKGLFEYIDPNGAEAKALEAEGYVKEEWGKQLIDNYDEYYTYLFYDYDYSKAPIYLWPFTPNVLSTGGFTNGYGFKQE